MDLGPAPALPAAGGGRALGGLAAGGGVGIAHVLGLHGLAGNRAVSRLVARGPLIQRQGKQPAQPPPSQEELDAVRELMPVMPDIEALVAAVQAECAAWTGWRGQLTGAMPGAGAFRAMSQFKEAVRAHDFVWHDARIQTNVKRRLEGDARQALTEMCSFALGSENVMVGDSSGLATIFGVQAKTLTHRYTLKISYSVGVKGKLGIGVSYTYRSAAIAYSNDFGMGYNKPLNARSAGGSVGPGLGASVGSVGFSGEAPAESLSFWRPEDFETGFEVIKVAAAGAAGGKVEVKAIELLRITSDKHPPLLFNLMTGQVAAVEAGLEAGAEVGGGVEHERGKLVGGPEVGGTSVTTPTLKEAHENAQKTGLIPPDQAAGVWVVIGATVVSFGTGRDTPEGDQVGLIVKFARYVARWAEENPDGELRFEITGQASPRWRHPKKGEVSSSLNQRLSEQRARSVAGAIDGAWDAQLDAQFQTKGIAGPIMELPENSVRATGRGSLDAQAEGADPDNDDASYRIASVTAWGKAKPQTAPAQEPAPTP